MLLGRRGAHRVSAREAGAWSVVWIALALAFSAALWRWLDGQLGRDIANQKALEFLTGYLVEKALAVDNIFAFVVIFSYFAVPAEYQRRVLLHGAHGAIVLRAVMILAGAVLIGAKMLLAEVYKLPIGVALGLVALILAGSVLASGWQDRHRRV